MNRYRFATLVAALGLSPAAFAAAPQYALIDLGSTDVAGAGLVFQGVRFNFAPADWPSVAGGTLGTNQGYVYATYGTVAVGQSPAPNNERHAAEWTWPNELNAPVSVTDLGVLPGALPEASSGPTSEASAFNTQGDAVGASDTQYASAYLRGDPASHAVLYHSGQVIDLGSLAGPTYNSGATSINDSGEIVGETDTISTATGGLLGRAFVYVNGTMYNLSFYLVGPLTSVRLTDALAIDCEGDIAALGTPAPGASTHNYLLIRQGTARTCPQ